MSSLTKLTFEQVRTILKQYALSLTSIDPISFELMTGGWANSNYDVQLKVHNRRFCLKVCDEKSVEQVRVNVKLCEHLRQKGYRSAYAHVALSGERFALLDNKPCLLMEFLDGDSGDQFEPRTERMVAELGGAVAQLSVISVPSDFREPFAMGFTEMILFLEEVGDMPRAAELRSHWFVEMLRDDCVARLVPLLADATAALPRGLVHGDAYIDNALFRAKDGALVALIDFEEICVDALALDLAMAILGCCFVDSELQEHLVRALVRGYTAKRQLTPIEIKLFAHLVEYACYAIAFWRFRQFEVRVPESDTKSSFIEPLEQKNQLLELKWNEILAPQTKQ